MKSDTETLKRHDVERCVVTTPEKKVVDQDVTFVVVPLYDGEFGVYPRHSPVVGRLGSGEMRLTLEDGSIERWHVEGGFVEVANDVVSLLTDRAWKATDSKQTD